MAVVKKSAVTIYFGIRSFSKNCLGLIHIELIRKFCAITSLHAVVRPKYLFQATKLNKFKRFFVLLIGRKTFMIGWVPVLCCYHKLKIILKLVDNGNDLVTIRHSQRTAG